MLIFNKFPSGFCKFAPHFSTKVGNLCRFVGFDMAFKPTAPVNLDYLKTEDLLFCAATDKLKLLNSLGINRFSCVFLFGISRKSKRNRNCWNILLQPFFRRFSLPVYLRFFVGLSPLYRRRRFLPLYRRRFSPVCRRYFAFPFC